MNIPKWSHDELEAKSEEFLNHFGKFDGMMLLLEPTIAAYGYTIIPVRGLAEIAEAYLPAKKGIMFIDEEEYSGAQGRRYRFTLAEELAHSIIHRPMFDGMSVEQIQAAQSSITDAEYLAIEREAKYLAASLLMRKETFARHFAWLKKVQEARCPNELATLRYVIRRLSYAFNVSVHSAGLRSLKLGLIDQSEFDEVMESFSAN